MDHFRSGMVLQADMEGDTLDGFVESIHWTGLKCFKYFGKEKNPRNLAVHGFIIPFPGTKEVDNLNKLENLMTIQLHDAVWNMLPTLAIKTKRPWMSKRGSIARSQVA